MMKLFKNTSGASAAEYALMVAVMGGLVVAGSRLFATSLQDGMEQSGNAILTQSTDSAATTSVAPTTK